MNVNRQLGTVLLALAVVVLLEGCATGSPRGSLITGVGLHSGATSFRYDSGPRQPAAIPVPGEVVGGADDFPEQTADFTYARLMNASEEEPLGYPEAELDRIAGLAREWADGGKRDLFVFFIAGAKIRNPAAAQALIARLGR